MTIVSADLIATFCSVASIASARINVIWEPTNVERWTTALTWVIQHTAPVTHSNTSVVQLGIMTLLTEVMDSA